jgi:hypothetical protein
MITQISRELMTLAPEIHQINVEKGFWPENRNRGEQMMLVITELSECLEAHREDNWFLPETKLRKHRHENAQGWAWDVVEKEQEAWMNWFRAEVKNTVQDEMADTAIRLLDYIFGHKTPYTEREFTFGSKGNFGEDLLGVTRRCMNAYATEGSPEEASAWGYALANILRFCEWYQIDILTHVRWKIAHNKLRPHKHGKAY